MATSCRKRKYKEENRTFLPEWEEDFAFIDKDGRPICLICQTPLANYKASNLKRHYEKSHEEFASRYPLQSELRKSKLAELKSGMCQQQTLLSAFSKEGVTSTEASYAIAWNIARAKRPYSDGDFIKKNIEEVISILDPNNSRLRRLITQIPMSRHTTERRISDINADIEGKMTNDLKNCVAFSLALDESTDIQDTPQLAVFVRYVSLDVAVKEELLNLVALKDTTRGIDVKNALDKTLMDAGVPLNKLVSVATDGAPSMLGKNVGLMGLLTNDTKYPDILPVHCIIHRENLAAKYFKFESVMTTVLQIVNFIRSSAKNHRQFINFIGELDLEDKPDDLSFHCVVRWLSTSNVLNRFVDLLEPITAFLSEKDKSYPQLADEDWMEDLMFLTDIMQHLQNLNLSLQGKDKLISDLIQTVFSFQNKIQILQRDILSREFKHFPRLQNRVSSYSDGGIQLRKLGAYRDRLQGLLEDFQARFNDLHQLKSCSAFLINPFMIDVIKDGFQLPMNIVMEPSAAEMELLELQEDQGLAMIHKSQSVMDFWKLVPEVKYPQLKKASCRLISIFGTTYCCESLYSTMKFIKSKHRAVTSNQHLTELLRTTTTSYQPDLKKLASSKASQQNHNN